MSSSPLDYLTMELEEIFESFKNAIVRYIESRPNLYPSGDKDEEIQRLKRDIEDLRGTVHNMKEKSDSQRLEVFQIMNGDLPGIGRLEGKGTTREGPKVHSPVRDSQLAETASTSSSDMADGIVENGVNSTQLTRKHQTQGSLSLRSQDRPGGNDRQRSIIYENDHPHGGHLENINQSPQEEEPIFDQHGSDLEGQLGTSYRLTKTESRKSDDESAKVKKPETRRRVKDASQKPMWQINTRGEHRRYPIRPSSQPDR